LRERRDDLTPEGQVDPKVTVYARIIVDETGPALHILRPDAPPEVVRLTLGQLSALVAQGAASVSEWVRTGAPGSARPESKP